MGWESEVEGVGTVGVVKVATSEEERRIRNRNSRKHLPSRGVDLDNVVAVA